MAGPGLLVFLVTKTSKLGGFDILTKTLGAVAPIYIQNLEQNLGFARWGCGRQKKELGADGACIAKP